MSIDIDSLSIELTPEARKELRRLGAVMAKPYGLGVYQSEMAKAFNRVPDVLRAIDEQKAAEQRQRDIDQERQREEFRATNESLAYQRQSYKEMLIDVQVQAAQIIKTNEGVGEQVKPLADAGAVDGAKPKDRKRLNPLERETNEGLLLLYEMFHYYEIQYLDELSAHKAWGRIISGKFKSELIREIAQTGKHIILSGGEKLSKVDFSDKYRKRFLDNRKTQNRH